MSFLAAPLSIVNGTLGIAAPWLGTTALYFCNTSKCENVIRIKLD